MKSPDTPEFQEEDRREKEVSLTTWQLLALRQLRNPIICYVSLALTEICLLAVLSVWLFTPIEVRCLRLLSSFLKALCRMAAWATTRCKSAQLWRCTALLAESAPSGFRLAWRSDLEQSALTVSGQLATLSHLCCCPSGTPWLDGRAEPAWLSSASWDCCLWSTSWVYVHFGQQPPSLTVNSASRLPR
jgi:hypothetical protein